MSDDANFLERWSRRKREAAADRDSRPEDREVKKDDTEAEPASAQMPPPAEANKAEPGKPFDLADLPPIESIGANTDVRAFLQPGVPEELTRAALRRAWSADPAIRDFVGLVESGWDFNDPHAMHGFGSIKAEEVARLLNQAVGAVMSDDAQKIAAPTKAAAGREEIAQDASTPAAAAPAQAASSVEQSPATLQCNEKNDAAQKESES